MIQVNASFKSTRSKLQKLVVSVLVRFFITQQLKVHKVVFAFRYSQTPSVKFIPTWTQLSKTIR